MDRVCPLLALATDRRAAIDGADATHRCYADEPPGTIERQYQAQVCLTADHDRCDRFLNYVARTGASHPGRSELADGLVSTRLLLAPEPAWRGFAGRARHAAGTRPLVALGAGFLAAGVGAATIAAAVIDGEVGAAPTRPTPTAIAEPTAPPTPTPRPTLEPTVAPTPTTVPTASPQPATAAPTAAPTQPPPPPQPQTYTVQQGDTLAAIAERFGTTVAALQAQNGIDDPNSIIIGQVLVIP